MNSSYLSDSPTWLLSRSFGSFLASLLSPFRQPSCSGVCLWFVGTPLPAGGHPGPQAWGKLAWQAGRKEHCRHPAHAHPLPYLHRPLHHAAWSQPPLRISPNMENTWRGPGHFASFSLHFPPTCFLLVRGLSTPWGLVSSGPPRGQVVHHGSMCLAPKFLSSCANKDQLEWWIEKMEVRLGGNTHMIFQSFPLTVVAGRVQNANQIASTPFPKLSVAFWCPQQNIHTPASVFQAPHPLPPSAPCRPPPCL